MCIRDSNNIIHCNIARKTGGIFKHLYSLFNRITSILNGRGILIFEILIKKRKSKFYYIYLKINLCWKIEIIIHKICVDNNNILQFSFDTLSGNWSLMTNKSRKENYKNIVYIIKIAYLSLSKLKHWYTFKNNKRYRQHKGKPEYVILEVIGEYIFW